MPLLVRLMLGLEPDPESRRLNYDPELPEKVRDLRLKMVDAEGRNVPLGAGNAG